MRISILFFLFLFIGNQLSAQIKEVKKSSLPYEFLVYYPKGYDKSKADKYPLLMYLHGRSIRGRDLEMVKRYGVIYEIIRGLEIDFVVIAPQCQTHWENDKLIEVLDYAEQNFKVDRQRVYLTGMSMGGYGAWYLAGEHPDRFAAVAPVAGGGKTKDAPNMKDLPHWIHHGKKDKPVPVEESRKMVVALEAAGNKEVKYSEYKDWDHGDAVRVFAMPELYNWFLGYTKTGIAKEPEIIVSNDDDDPNLPNPEPEPEPDPIPEPEPAPEPKDEHDDYLDFDDPDGPDPEPEPEPKKPKRPQGKAKWWQFWRWKIWSFLK